MRTHLWLLLLAALATLIGGCAGQTASPTPAGLPDGKPTLLYLYADP